MHQLMCQSGKIWRLERTGSGFTKSLFGDFNADVYSQRGPNGLQSVAFHPKFADNGYLYVNYTSRQPRLKTFISEFRVDPAAKSVDTTTERVILTTSVTPLACAFS